MTVWKRSFWNWKARRRRHDDPCIAPQAAAGAGRGLSPQQQDRQSAVPGIGRGVCAAVCRAGGGAHALLCGHGPAAGFGAAPGRAGLAVFCLHGAHGAAGERAGQRLYQLFRPVPEPGQRTAALAAHPAGGHFRGAGEHRLSGLPDLPAHGVGPGGGVLRPAGSPSAGRGAVQHPYGVGAGRSGLHSGGIAGLGRGAGQ